MNDKELLEFAAKAYKLPECGWIALKTGWLWADIILEAHAPKETK